MLKGKRNITTDTALRLAKKTGTRKPKHSELGLSIIEGLKQVVAPHLGEIELRTTAGKIASTRPTSRIRIIFNSLYLPEGIPAVPGPFW